MTTHQGKRENNQDYSGTFMNQSDLLIALLADGLGGHQAGDIASEMIVSQLGNKWERSSFTGNNPINIEKWLDTEINQENERIYKVANKYPDLKGMGTTLVTATILDEQILIANIGDSRGYIYKDQELKQITKDHSFVSELRRKGQLTEEEAKNHYNKNALTRSLGIKDKVEIDFFSY
ncbi:MAG: protein phosphatase 2C domain-containing protein [Atopostipes sp.]|nr:protein phosphatase 2C domain-containing protein [Atopostipes sp.]